MEKHFKVYIYGNCFSYYATDMEDCIEKVKSNYGFEELPETIEIIEDSNFDWVNDTDQQELFSLG